MHPEGLRDTSRFGILQGLISQRGAQASPQLSNSSKQSIFPDTLLLFKSRLDLTTSVVAATWCLFVVARYVSQKIKAHCLFSTNFDRNYHLGWEDIKFTRNSAVQDQVVQDHLAQGSSSLRSLASIPGSDLCPVSAVLQYFTLVPPPKHLFLLHVTRSLFACPDLCVHWSLRPLIYAAFTRQLATVSYLR